MMHLYKISGQLVKRLSFYNEFCFLDDFKTVILLSHFFPILNEISTRVLVPGITTLPYVPISTNFKSLLDTQLGIHTQLSKHV